MTKRIRYARVLTKGQDIDRQIQGLITAEVQCNDLYIDHGLLGVLSRRPGLDKALDSLHPDGILAITILDRVFHTENALTGRRRA